MPRKDTRRMVVAQPEPFTPGLTKSMVRERARRLHHKKGSDAVRLTLEEWVLAEKDLAEEIRRKRS